MSNHTNLAHELLADVESTVITAALEELKKQGLQDKVGELPQNIAVAVGLRLSNAWAGQQVYIPRDIARRNARIYDDFTGSNMRELVEKYRLSAAATYQIIASERQRRRIKQLSLPGMA